MLVALSAHGFGHAAQTAPVVNTLRSLVPNLRVTLRTDLPKRFLTSRFDGGFELLPGTGDFGMVMESALTVGLERSAQRYAALHAEWEARIADESTIISRLKPDLVLSNISYLVLAGARAARVPGVGLGSFTWDQVYAHYFASRREAAKVLEQMRAAYMSAEQLLALQPGMPLAGFPRVTSVGVVARVGQSQASLLRQHLRLSADARLVVVSLGGIDHAIDLGQWPQFSDLHWVVPKSLLPARTDMTAQEDLPFHFTDLLASADALITKPGYGNFTEAACNGAPLLYVPRPDWPEQPYLLDWITRHGRARPLGAERLDSGDLRASLAELWSLARLETIIPEGGWRAARMLANYL